MREMKDWIPSRIKYHCTMNSGVNITSLDISDEGIFPVYGGNGLRGYFNKFNHNGDYLLIGRQGALAGNVHRVCGKFWATEHALVTQVYPGTDINFFFYLLISMNLNQYAFDTAAQPGIAVSKIRELCFNFPPLPEQRLIASFLNAKCAEIDALTADIQEQIDTLEQYKRSVITEAVTKGLNPNAEMKDSGIKWIGRIPAHWEIHPVYFYFGERKNRNRLGLENNLLSLSYGRIIQKDINTSEGLLPESFDTYNIVEVGDIIIRPTDLQNDKRSLRTGLVKDHGIITSAYIALYPLKELDTRYFHYLLHSFDVMKVFYNMGNGVRQGLNFSEFSRLMIFEPSREEQTAIADYLDSKCAEIDGIVTQKREQISTIEEYKKSLIFEYVTGKKDVEV